MLLMTAELIIQGAQLRTQLPGHDVAAPQSVAIAGGRILAVGAPDEISETFRGSATRVDDASGRTLTPG